MHASISAHIAKEYLLDERADKWGPNLALFRERLGNEGVRERVENLYFAYLFVLRAALKAGPLLREAAYDTGSPLEDARTCELVRKLVGSLILSLSKNDAIQRLLDHCCVSHIKQSCMISARQDSHKAILPLGVQKSWDGLHISTSILVMLKSERRQTPPMSCFFHPHV